MIQWIFFNDLPINSFMFDLILLNCTNMTILFVFIHFYNNGVTRKEQTFMGEYTEQYCYAIKMMTPVGIRDGSIVLNINNKDISGYLDILNHQNVLSGKILEHGQCELKGEIVSLMRKSNYTAVGTFDFCSIQLTLKEEKNNYELYGIAKDWRIEL